MRTVTDLAGLGDLHPRQRVTDRSGAPWRVEHLVRAVEEAAHYATPSFRDPFPVAITSPHLLRGCVFCDKLNDSHDETVTWDPSSGMTVASFQPLRPVTEGHRLFVPSQHLAHAGADPHITGRVFQAAAQYAASLMQSFNLITSAGDAATQTVYHLHVHVVPRRAGDGLRLPWTEQP